MTAGPSQGLAGSQASSQGLRGCGGGCCCCCNGRRSRGRGRGPARLLLPGRSALRASMPGRGSGSRGPLGQDLTPVRLYKVAAGLYPRPSPGCDIYAVMPDTSLGNWGERDLGIPSQSEKLVLQAVPVAPRQPCWRGGHRPALPPGAAWVLGFGFGRVTRCTRSVLWHPQRSEGCLVVTHAAASAAKSLVTLCGSNEHHRQPQ